MNERQGLLQHQKLTGCVTPKGPTYSVDDAVNKVGYGRFQTLLTFLAGLGWMADASEILILSLIGDLIACDWPLLRWQNALLTSAVFGGMMIGSPILGMVADIYGRKRSLALSSIFVFVFGAVTAASPSYPWMVVFRSCMGFALGGLAQGLTLYSEYCPADKRGKAGFYLCYFWSFGTIVIILMTWLVMDSLDNWRVLLAVASLPAFLVILTLKWYPESARFFLVSNQYDKANKVLKRMALMNGKDLPVGNLVHMPECSKRGRIVDLFQPEYMKTTILFWYIWFAVAFAYYGIALISPTIIQQGGLRSSESKGNQSMSFSDNMQMFVHCTKFTQSNYIDLLWTSAAEFPGILAFTFLVECFSRKVFLSASCALSGILFCLLLLKTRYKILILIFLFGARGIISAVFQLLLIMTSEAFPTTLRAIAMGSGGSWGRLGGLLAPYVAQVLVIEYPQTAILILAVLIILAAVAAACLPVETKGAKMKEIPGYNG